jgi:hypothetical protein
MATDDNDFDGDLDFDDDDVDDALDSWRLPEEEDPRPEEEPGFACRESFTATYAEVAVTSQELRGAGRTEWVASLAERLREIGCPSQVSSGFVTSMQAAGQYLALEAAVMTAALLIRFVGSGERGRIMKFNRALHEVRSFQIEQNRRDQTYTLHVTGELPYATGGFVGGPPPIAHCGEYVVTAPTKAPVQTPKPHEEAPRRLRVRRPDAKR